MVRLVTTHALAIAALAVASQGLQAMPISTSEGAGETLLYRFADTVSNVGDFSVARLPMMLEGYRDLPANGFKGLNAQFPPRVPEPATLSLIGIALAGFGLSRWRKRK